MNFRIKSKHWKGKGLTSDKYDPEQWFAPGCQAWKLRTTANDFYKAGLIEKYKVAKAELFAFLNKKEQLRKKNGSVLLALELKHGDIIHMHGEKMQEIYEVSIQLNTNLTPRANILKHEVRPKGKLRYGLTARYIKPENIPVKEHWKGNFTIPPEKVYDGDLAIYKAHFPEEEEEGDN